MSPQSVLGHCVCLLGDQQLRYVNTNWWRGLGCTQPFCLSDQLTCELVANASSVRPATQPVSLAEVYINGGGNSQVFALFCELYSHFPKISKVAELKTSTVPFAHIFGWSVCVNDIDHILDVWMASSIANHLVAWLLSIESRNTTQQHIFQQRKRQCIAPTIHCSEEDTHKAMPLQWSVYEIWKMGPRVLCRACRIFKMSFWRWSGREICRVSTLWIHCLGEQAVPFSSVSQKRFSLFLWKVLIQHPTYSNSKLQRG